MLTSLIEWQTSLGATMKLDLGLEFETFREELRDWVEDNRPDGLEGLDERAMYFGAAGLSGRGAEAYRLWTDRLRDARLICPQWPEEVGGRGLSGVHMAVLNEEFHRAGLPRVQRGMGESLNFLWVVVSLAGGIYGLSRAF